MNLSYCRVKQLESQHLVSRHDDRTCSPTMTTIKPQLLSRERAAVLLFLTIRYVPLAPDLQVKVTADRIVARRWSTLPFIVLSCLHCLLCCRRLLLAAGVCDRKPALIPFSSSSFTLSSSVLQQLALSYDRLI